jgi:hypothetical protein
MIAPKRGTRLSAQADKSEGIVSTQKHDPDGQKQIGIHETLRL